MESFEKNTQPNIETDLLIETISKLNFDNYEIFSYLGKDYCLFLSEEQKDESGNGFFTTASSLVDGADIYILESLSEQERRRTLFHETLEASIAAQGFADEAHELALAEEIKHFGER